MTAVSAAALSADPTGLDPSIIDGLATIMQPGAVRSLLADMRSDVSLRLERLSETEVTSASLVLIAQDAHDLKSMGGNFGLMEMSVRAGVVERAARGGCTETVSTSLPLLIAMGRRSLAALAERYEICGGRPS